MSCVCAFTMSFVVLVVRQQLRRVIGCAVFAMDRGIDLASLIAAPIAREYALKGTRSLAGQSRNQVL